MASRSETLRSGDGAIRVALRAVPIPRVSGGAFVFAIPLVAYLALGAFFAFGAATIAGDALSRVGNAYYVLFSRDPHLAAMGFVWNPLPSMAALPLVALSGVWPPLVQQGFAANVVSAVFMAAAVYQLRGWCRDLGLGTLASLVVTGLFAAHPLIALYGANGMSEAPFVFFLVVAARRLGAWVRTQEVAALVLSGGALALAYLTRPEAIAAAIAGCAVVGALSFVHAQGRFRDRGAVARADVALFGAPFAAAFAAWALASWIIVGSPFETFTSVYGGSNQIALAIETIRQSTGDTPAAALSFAARQILGLEPLLLPILIIGGTVGAFRRDARMLAVVAIFGSVLLFSLGLFLAGKSYGWLRFYIGLIPLAAMAAGAAIAGIRGRPRNVTFAALLRSPGPRAKPMLRHVVGTSTRGALIGLTLMLVGVGLPSGLATVRAPDLAREEDLHVSGLSAASGREIPWEWHQYRLAGDVARYLDSLGLPDGAVVVDVALGFWIVLQSDRPRQFVITPDRDFDSIVADPAAFGARYLLVSPSSGLGGVTAIARAYPGIFETGAGVAILDREFSSPDGAQYTWPWRLYRVGGK